MNAAKTTKTVGKVAGKTAQETAEEAAERTARETAQEVVEKVTKERITRESSSVNGSGVTISKEVKGSNISEININGKFKILIRVIDENIGL